MAIADEILKHVDMWPGHTLRIIARGNGRYALWVPSQLYYFEFGPDGAMIEQTEYIGVSACK